MRLLPAALVLALTASAASIPLPASAGGDERRLRPIVKVRTDAGVVVLRACKEKRQQGRAWRVFLRLDNREGWRGASSALVAYLHDEEIARWLSGSVSDGRRSSIGSVLVPRSNAVEARTAVNVGTAAGIGQGPLDVERC